MIRFSHRIRIRPVGVLLLLAGLVPQVRQASGQPSIRMETTMVPMSDGVSLASDVYLPPGDGPFPTVLMRTPYDASGRGWFGEGLAERGLAVVVQDVRGQGRSEGRFIPFAHERTDGYDTADWIVSQPWSNGKIGVWGASYNGFAAFELAMSGHPGVAAIYHISGYSDLATFLSRGGAFQLRAHLYWYYSYASAQNPPPADAWPEIFKTVPIGQFFRGAEAVWDLAAAPYDHSDITVPVMHVTGWYDYIYPNTLGTYRKLVEADPDREQVLVIGPWSHNGVLNNWTTVGEADFGEAASAGIEWSLEQSAQWFRHILQGEENELSRSKPVRYFVMNENRWRETDAWPPPESEPRSWFATDGGRLSTDPPTTSGVSTFVYDPLDPVPTTGGANAHFFPEDLGPKDQSAIVGRGDVLHFTSEPLEEDLTIAGPVEAVVYASTTGLDTDFTAKLNVVRGDGSVWNLEDGIVRARHLFPGTDSTGYVVPGEIYRYRIEMGATATTLRAGERLQLLISSSNFPKYDRNPNTGVDPIQATEFVKATQTVHYASGYQTRIVVPVIR